MRRVAFWFGMMALALPGCSDISWPQAADLPIVELPVLLHFSGTSGETVTLPPGRYRVEADGSTLKLLRDDPTAPPAVFIAAESKNHKEVLKETAVKITRDQNNPDIYHLAVLRTDGTGLESVGAKSGMQPRGTRSP
jgi:hypothetical protein